MLARQSQPVQQPQIPGGGFGGGMLGSIASKLGGAMTGGLMKQPVAAPVGLGAGLGTGNPTGPFDANENTGFTGGAAVRAEKAARMPKPVQKPGDEEDIPDTYNGY